MTNHDKVRHLLRELHADIVRVLSDPKANLTLAQRKALQRSAVDALEISRELEAMRKQRKSPMQSIETLLQTLLPFLGNYDDH